MKEIIEQKRKEYFAHISESRDKEAMLYKEMRKLQLKYVKDTYGVEDKDMFIMDEIRYAIEYFAIYDTLDANGIFVSCSRLLKRGGWSVKTKTFTLDEILLNKEIK